MKFEKNDVLEIEAEELGCNGEGVAHADGIVVFLRGALPGERVRAKIILVKPSFLVGLVLQILRKSPARRTPPCPVFGKCGGCVLQHLGYPEQLEYKRRRVSDALKRIGGLDCTVNETVPSPAQYRYRNKLSLPVRGDPPRIGFFAPNSHRLVPVSDCLIQFPENEKLVALFCRFAAREKLAGYDETRGTGDVRHLVARKIGGKTTVAVVTPRAALPQISAFNALLSEEWGAPYALYLNYNDKNTNAIWGGRTEFVGGSTAPVTADGLTVEVHPKSFFQVNDPVRTRIYADILGLARGTVLDAYSGAGVLSALLARAGHRVIAVEREEAAVASALRLNAANGITGVETVRGDCAERIPALASALTGGELTVVLDPPRAGCDQRVLTAVAGASPLRVAYLSCDPATLARDAARLNALGYVPERVTPYDMFPNTPEVETLVEFVPKT